MLSESIGRSRIPISYILIDRNRFELSYATSINRAVGLYFG
jgi:hypothetical protein